MGMGARDSQTAEAEAKGTRALGGLAIWLVVCFAAPALSVGSPPGDWYATLSKPGWNPPNAVFGPVWTALYTMMAVAAWLVWRRGGFRAQRRALGWFLAQLALNALWTPVFFGLHQLGWAFAVIILLWLAIAGTALAFWRVKALAAALLLPYLAWVSFAAFLNFTLWRMNA